MKVMHFMHPSDLFDGLANFFEPNAFGNRLHEDADGFLNQTPRRIKNQHTNEDADQRVRKIPSGEKHNKTGGDRSYGAQRIANPMQNCSPHVQVWWMVQ